MSARNVHLNERKPGISRPQDGCLFRKHYCHQPRLRVVWSKRSNALMLISKGSRFAKAETMKCVDKQIINFTFRCPCCEIYWESNIAQFSSLLHLGKFIHIPLKIGQTAKTSNLGWCRASRCADIITEKFGLERWFCEGSMQRESPISQRVWTNFGLVRSVENSVAAIDVLLEQDQAKHESDKPQLTYLKSIA